MATDLLFIVALLYVIAFGWELLLRNLGWCVLGVIVSGSLWGAFAFSDEGPHSHLSKVSVMLMLMLIFTPLLTLMLRIVLFFLPSSFQPTTGPAAELRASRAMRRLNGS